MINKIIGDMPPPPGGGGPATPPGIPIDMGVFVLIFLILIISFIIYNKTTVK